jgi:hypothetical protein
LLGIVRGERETQDELVRGVQRLIDWSSDANVVRPSADKRPQIVALRAERDRLVSSIDSSWLAIDDELRRLAGAPAGPRTTDVAWDYFLAYASADREIAELVYEEVSGFARVFMDAHCLLGERVVLPYGLEQLHALRMHSRADVATLPAQLT